MTIDDERWRAIENTRNWLYELFMDRKKPIPKVSEVRKMAYILWKHYPEPYFMEHLRKIYEEWLGEGKER